MTSGAPCIRFDIDRDTRIGIAEAVFCEGKPERALVTLLTRFSDPAEKPILFTRLSESVFERLPVADTVREACNYDPLSRTAWFKTREKPRAQSRGGVRGDR